MKPTSFLVTIQRGQWVKPKDSCAVCGLPDCLAFFYQDVLKASGFHRGVNEIFALLEILHSVEWYFVSDILEQAVIKGQPVP
jgi:hypothetical protein